MELCVARGNTDRTRMGLTVQDKRDDGPKEACASMNDGLHVAARSAELEKKLRSRADREHLVQKNILPDFSSSPILFTYAKELQKKKNADNLQKKLRNRPERQNLMQMNILPVDTQVNVDPGLMSKQMSLKKNQLADTLNRKLASRPGPLELIQGRILEPHNPELSAVVRSDVMRCVLGPDEAGQISSSVANKDAGISRQATSVTSPQGEFSPPSKDTLTSPTSDSSGHPHSPEEMHSPVNQGGLMSPPFNLPSLIPPSPMQVLTAVHMPGIPASRKTLSPSQARKKQQKQKYRKLRYHEYVPPTKNNGKGGKTNPKPVHKQESPYNHVLQQQQLFLQLQVLQQQYPNGVLMQKLPDIVDSLSKTGGKGGVKGRVTSPAGGVVSTIAGSPVSVPQIVMVEQNRFQVNSIRFEELKVSDLKVACKEMGMIVSGKKAELVERLLEHNNGFLPAIALPETQTREAHRPQSVRTGHPSMLDPQVPMSGYSPPSPTSLSPVFKFPGDQNNARNINDNSTSAPTGGNSGRKGSLSSLSSMGTPQVIPALSLQQRFDDMVERQKRSYICEGQMPKSIAPRPELGDMVAITFPRPVDTQQRGGMGGGGGRGGGESQTPQPQRHSGKGLTLPRQGSGGAATETSKMAVSPFDKHSHSLPSSPQPLSPSNSTSQLIGELMDDSTSDGQQAPKSLQTIASSGATGVTSTTQDGRSSPPPLRKLQQQTFMSSAPPCPAIATTTNGHAFLGAYSSHTNHHAPLMATNSYYSPQQPNTKPPLRQSQSISSVPVHRAGAMLPPPKVHLGNPPPPPYGSGGTSGLVQRSMSLNNPYQPGLHHPRLHSGASFSSDTGEMLNPQEGMFFQDDLATHSMDVPMEAQMDTHESTTHPDLSEIFSILEADPSGFAVPGQPPSYSSKLGGSQRQDSLRSDSVMLGSGMTYQSPNPPLGLMHKSNSDLCLVESSHKHSMNPPPYSGAMLGAGIGWLDPSDGGGMMSDMSPSVGSLGLSSSNPGSLTHEGFQMNFLDDLSSHGKHTATNNPSLNGFSQGEYLTHSLPTSSALLFQQDESQTLLELGLSTS